MVLKFNAPDSIKSAVPNAVYLIPFDERVDGTGCDGWLYADSSKLKAFVDGKEIYAYDIHELSEYRISVAVGCGCLEARLSEDTPVIICRFTQRHVNRISEFSKAVKSFAETGVWAESTKDDERMCLKCGRPLISGTSICPFCTEKFSLLTRFLGIARPYLKPIIFSGILMFIASLFSMVIPAVNQEMVDNNLVRPNASAPQSGFFYSLMKFAGLGGMKNAVWQVIIYVALIYLSNVFSRLIVIVSSRISTRASNSLSSDLRVAVYDKVQYMSMTSISKRSPGDLMNRINNDTVQVQSFISDAGRQIFLQLFQLIIIGTFMFAFDWKLTLLALSTLPFALYGMRVLWTLMHPRFEVQWRYGNKANSVLHDIVRGIRVVKSFGKEDEEIRKFDEVSYNLAQVTAANDKLWTMLSTILSFVIGAGEFLVLYYGGLRVVDGAMTVGKLVQFTAYIGFIYGPLQWMATLPRQMATFATSAAKLFEILDEQSDINDPKEPDKFDIKGEIQFKDVHFGYKSYEPVLKGINFTINPGEMVGIVGPSGVGKSTIINLILRFYDVNSGQVLIDGHDIRELTQKDLRDATGAVFQEIFLFSGTIYENILYANPSATSDDVFAAAKLANAHEFIMETADGYNTKIGENGSSLSGGERQRLAIARAILRDPKILIMDEATASLDTETESLIQEALSRLIKGRTTIAIAHRLSTLRHADKLIVLEKGKIAEMGTHEELLKLKGVYYRLVMAQRQTNKMSGNSAKAPTELVPAK